MNGPNPHQSKLCELLGVQRDSKRVLVYAPQKDVALEVLTETWDYLKTCQDHTFADLLEQATGSQQNTLATLSRADLFTAFPEATHSERRFAPNALLVLPTARCNLRCRYCFSSGGNSSTTLSTEAVHAAIDFVAQQIVSKGTKTFRLSFLGGGEPTLAWDIVEDALDFAKTTTARLGLSLKTSITSNCTWSRHVGECIGANFRNITVSLDGTRAVMGYHRPTATGSNVFDTVIRNINALTSMGCVIGIRSTVSAFSVGNMLSALDLFTTLGARKVHFEPLAPVGRSHSTDIQPPEPQEFFDRWWQAYEVGRSRGIHVTSSFARGFWGKSYYCTVPEKIVCLTPGGRFTACHRSADDNGQIGNPFHYGTYDSATQTMRIDQNKLSLYLSQIEVVPHQCKTCIAKSHCAGGCYFNNHAFSGDLSGLDSHWCRLAREAACRFIEDRLHSRLHKKNERNTYNANTMHE